jgi:predicted MPP superfamily phosphohydrolase
VEHGTAAVAANAETTAGKMVGGYVAVCWFAAVVAVGDWIWRHLFHRPPGVLRYHRPRVLGQSTAEPSPMALDEEHHFLVRMPGNEILRLEVSERAFEIAHLPRELDRLSMVHLSDFHFTGRIGKSYFHEVVRECNLFEPELVVLTGDLVDNRACVDWASEILGRLKATYGVYFILGNHDLRVDTAGLRRLLTEAGLIDLGGRWLETVIRGQTVVLAGNEIPWMPPAADLTGAPPPLAQGGPLRIGLSHSPDQFRWARENHIDLLLAGHTHGGQIRIPLIGPIFAPSLSGVRYASGAFYIPPTIMHVTRGVSGELPVRMNCPPEMTHIILHSAAT